jgi:hypothetical protein
VGPDKLRWQQEEAADERGRYETKR